MANIGYSKVNIIQYASCLLGLGDSQELFCYVKPDNLTSWSHNFTCTERDIARPSC